MISGIAKSAPTITPGGHRWGGAAPVTHCCDWPRSPVRFDERSSLSELFMPSRSGRHAPLAAIRSGEHYILQSHDARRHCNAAADPPNYCTREIYMQCCNGWPAWMPYIYHIIKKMKNKKNARCSQILGRPGNNEIDTGPYDWRLF